MLSCFHRIMFFQAALLVAAAPVWAQSEPQELEAAPVVITQKPPTVLDLVDAKDGLTVRSLTKVGDIADDNGGTISVFAVQITTARTGQTSRGLAMIVAPRGSRPARIFVDDNAVPDLIDGLAAMTGIDRGITANTEVRGVYRYGNLAVYVLDDANGRVAAVRALQVAPITGQATFAVARFRSARLPDVVRVLRQARDVMEKAGK